MLSTERHDRGYRITCKVMCFSKCLKPDQSVHMNEIIVFTRDVNEQVSTLEKPRIEHYHTQYCINVLSDERPSKPLKNYSILPFP